MGARSMVRAVNKRGTLWGKLRWGVGALRDWRLVPRLRAHQRELDATEDLGQVVRQVCLRRDRGRIYANQDPTEIGELCRRVAQRRPAVILEIGTARGGTLYLWSRLAQDGATILSIDKPGEDGSVRAPVLSVYRRFGQERDVRVVLLPIDSHSEGAHARVSRVLAGRKVDLLFIDGDHSYEGVRADFYDYLPYLAPNAIVAMHDIAVPASDPAIQVQRLWDEIRARGFKTEAVIAEPGNSPGIGIVSMDAAAQQRAPSR